MPDQSKEILKWVAVGTVVLGLVGGIVQGVILAYWSGAKIEGKADYRDVPSKLEYDAHVREFHAHQIQQAQFAGEIRTELNQQGQQLDRIEVWVKELHNTSNGGG